MACEDCGCKICPLATAGMRRLCVWCAFPLGKAQYPVRFQDHLRHLGVTHG